MTSFDFDIPEKDLAGADHVARVGRKLIAAFVKKARQDGLTKSELARRLDLDKATVSRMLHSNANLTLRTVGELCWAIGVRPDMLLIEDTDQGNRPSLATIHVTQALRAETGRTPQFKVTAQ